MPLSGRSHPRSVVDGAGAGASSGFDDEQPTRLARITIRSIVPTVSLAPDSDPMLEA